MNLVFMGSAAFAVPSLIALMESRHQIRLVVTQPDKPAGRGKELAACPVALCAREKALPLFQPTTLKTDEVEERLKAAKADLFVVVAYGKLLPPAILAIPRKGCMNVHASLLPKYRGAAPIQWAIANGETMTGVTTIFLTEEMDAGDILLSYSTKIDECETAVELQNQLCHLGAEVLQKTLDALEACTVQPRPQSHAQATYAPILKKEDGHIDWSLPAKAIYNRIRAFTPWPGVFAFLEGQRLHIHEAAAVDGAQHAQPGIVMKGAHELVVAAGQGELYLLEVQLEGKRAMPVQEFLRGHRIDVGMRLT